MRMIIKKIGKRIIIYFMVCMILFSSISYGYSQEEVGNAIAGFGAHVISEYGDQVEYSQPKRNENPIWSPESYTWNDTSTYYFDCSSYASGCLYYVTGLISEAKTTSTLVALDDDPNFEVFTLSSIDELMPGDIAVKLAEPAHAVLYLGQEYSAWDTSGSLGNNGSTFRSISYLNKYSFYIIRVSETGASKITSLNTEFSTLQTGSSSSSSSGVEFSNFYFNGIPDGKYSVAHTSLWTTIIETLSQIADYLVGLLTYLIRIPYIGWAAIVDNLINWTVETITDNGTTAEDLGISSVEVEGADDENRLTIDGLLYNDFDLTDINIFE